MENYFNYFTEIEEHFQKRRGQATLLSPLDWSLIESFQEAGIPMDVVLRGIDRVFEKYDRTRNKVTKINSLAYCTQAILSEYQRQKESSVGKGSQPRVGEPQGMTERENVMQLLSSACERLREAADQLQGQATLTPVETLQSVAKSLREMRTEVSTQEQVDFESLELRLSMLEDKVLASLTSALSDEALLTLRAGVHQEISRHKRGLKAEHISLLEKKMITKKIFDQFRVPRLSLFYLPLN